MRRPRAVFRDAHGHADLTPSFPLSACGEGTAEGRG